MSNFATKNVALAQLSSFLFSPTGQVQINTTGKTESCYLSCRSISSKAAGSNRHLPGHVQRREKPSYFVVESQSAEVLERIKMSRKKVPFHQMHSTFLNWMAEMQTQDFLLAACQASQTFSPFFYFSLLKEWQHNTKSLIQLWAYLQTISPRKRQNPEFFANKLSSK